MTKKDPKKTDGEIQTTVAPQVSNAKPAAKAADAKGTANKPQQKAPEAQMGAPKAKGKTISVKGPKKGRWRIGRFFSSEVVEIPLAELSAKDKAALKADKRLTVSGL